MSTHKHEFHAMYWHFGRYGPQDVHLHPCECGVELEGPGRECDGDATTHHPVRYDGRKREWCAA